MKHFRLIADGIDVAPLLAQIDAQPELWDRHRFRTGVKSPHAATSDIWVRYNVIERLGPRFHDEHVPVWYPAWKKLPALRPIIFDLMARVQGEMLCGVLITKVPPGERVAPHVDLGWHVNYTEKLYICLRGAPGARFHCQEDISPTHVRLEHIEPKPGECHLFDNRKRHWVTNDSEEDRITLIVCVRTDLFGRY